jgi:regulator of sirC expression with transglutaminase-like and TPR domain
MSAFADYASQSHLALDQGAALLAADEEPGLDPAAVLRALDELASSLHIPARSSPIEAVARLNHRLFAELGFAGDDAEYDHPDNSHLGRVLSRRRGLPILLSLVYIEVARRHGVGIDGIGFPGHFIVSPRGVEPRFFIDPFHKGLILRPDRLLQRLCEGTGARGVDPDAWARFTAAVDARHILYRMNNNLKAAWIRRGHLEGALRAVNRNLALCPADATENVDRERILLALSRR